MTAPGTRSVFSGLLQGACPNTPTGATCSHTPNACVQYGTALRPTDKSEGQHGPMGAAALAPLLPGVEAAAVLLGHAPGGRPPGHRLHLAPWGNRRR